MGYKDKKCLHLQSFSRVSDTIQNSKEGHQEEELLTIIGLPRQTAEEGFSRVST